MKSENNFISFDDEEIDALVERHFDNEEDDESESSDSYGNNEIAYNAAAGVFEKAQRGDAGNSLTTAQLPVPLLNVVVDISKRDGISQESVALALFTALSSVFADYIEICEKRNDPSAVLAAFISPLVVTGALNAPRFNFKRTLRSLLQSHNFVNLDSQNELFDFQTLVVDARRDFSGSKIKLFKRGETGRIEAVFAGNSFDKRGNGVGPDTQNFFVSIDEIGLQSVVKSVNNTSVLRGFALLNPAPVVGRQIDVAIDIDSIVAVSRIFARISDAVNELSNEDKLTLRFSPEAQGVYFKFVDDLKRHLDGSKEHPSLIAHLNGFDELFCKIALLLSLSEYAAAGTQITAECEIDLIAAERAWSWCAILEMHVREVFQNLLSTNSVENLILQKIAEGRLGESFTAREIARAQWTGLKSLVEIKKALIELVADGKLRAITEEGSGRPSTRYEPVDIEEVEVALDSETDESEDG